ncbi:hypothetical protein [Pseudomonas sp. NPDC089734]|uniref:hypothetical protein n=1 Tax=Pseudomonas sp. NPDC089734 TaxID=3364469 RepID=UPI00382B52FC
MTASRRDVEQDYSLKENEFPIYTEEIPLLDEFDPWYTNLASALHSLWESKFPVWNKFFGKQ